MTDEVQTPAAAVAAPEAAAPPPDTTKAADEQAALQRLVDGNMPPEPEKGPTDEEKAAVEKQAKAKAEYEGWAKDRVDRAKRQRDEAREQASYLGGSLDELRGIVDDLTSKLDPDQYPTHEAYLAAKKEILARAKTVREKAAAPVPKASALEQATKDLAFEVSRADPELWDDVLAGEEVDGRWVPKYTGVTEAMVIAIADADDSAGKLRALLAMPEDDRLELAGLSDRMQRKEIARLAPLAAKGKKAEPKVEDAKPAPARDPETGQFRKASAAPPPIDPLSGNGVAEKRLDKMTQAEFEAHRAAQRPTDRFGWR